MSSDGRRAEGAVGRRLAVRVEAEAVGGGVEVVDGRGVVETAGCSGPHPQLLEISNADDAAAQHLWCLLVPAVQSLHHLYNTAQPSLSHRY